MAKWSEIEKGLWEKNEVLREFEERIKRASIELGKKVNAQVISGKIQQTKKDLGEIDKKMTDVITKAKNLADDQTSESTESVNKLEGLISSLTKIAEECAEEGDTSKAYQIERAIDELKELLESMKA